METCLPTLCKGFTQNPNLGTNFIRLYQFLSSTSNVISSTIPLEKTYINNKSQQPQSINQLEESSTNSSSKKSNTINKQAIKPNISNSQPSLSTVNSTNNPKVNITTTDSSRLIPNDDFTRLCSDQQHWTFEILNEDEFNRIILKIKEFLIDRGISMDQTNIQDESMTGPKESSLNIQLPAKLSAKLSDTTNQSTKEKRHRRSSSFGFRRESNVES